MSALHTYSKNNKSALQIQEIIMAYRCGVFSHFFLICAIWIIFGFFHEINKNEVVCYDFFRRGCLAPAGGEYARLTSLVERGRGLAMETLRGKFKPFNISL